MVDLSRGASEAIPSAEVEDVELYHPKSWVTKYVFSQDAKVIAIQYSVTAFPGRQSHRHPVLGHGARDRIGRSGVVVVDAAATGVPRKILLYPGK